MSHIEVPPPLASMYKPHSANRSEENRHNSTHYKLAPKMLQSEKLISIRNIRNEKS